MSRNFTTTTFTKRPFSDARLKKRVTAIRRDWIVILAFLCSAQGMQGQQKASTPLSLPPYHNLPTTEGYFQGANGARLFFRIVGGEGDPIVFLHGGPGLGLEDGGYEMEPLAERGHRLLMFNERGAGRSEIISDAKRLRIEDFVQDVEEFTKKFGLHHFGIIGLSWGSGVALKYIVAHPKRVTRVVFLSPMSPTITLYHARTKYLDGLKSETERNQQRAAREQIKDAKDSDVPLLCEELFASTSRLYVLDIVHLKKTRTNFCNLPAAGLRNFPFVQESADVSLGEWDFRPELANVRIPALVVEGAETNVPLVATREWAKALPNSRLLLIPNAGHQNWIDQPDLVLAALDQFFHGQWPRGASVTCGVNAQ